MGMEACSTQTTSRICRRRTGCLTCRRRRKKCDERKPICLNCERNRICCEGYQNAVRWVSSFSKPNTKKQVQRRQDSSSPDGNSNNEDSTSKTPTGTFTITGGEEAEDTDTNKALVTQNNPLAIDPELLDLAFLLPESFMFNVGSPLPDYETIPIIPHPASSNRLPALIDGVHTPLERKLFSHFISALGPTLVLRSTESRNPFINAITQLALADQGILRLMLSVSANHLLRRCGGSRSFTRDSEFEDIERAEIMHFDYAIQQHSQRMDILLATAAAGNNISDVFAGQGDSMASFAFIATLLLTQYDTCLGGCLGVWQNHLKAARWLATSHLRKWLDGQGILPKRERQVLVDWFVYHDIISRMSETERIDVTGDALLQPTATASRLITRDMSTSDPLLVGPRDGLLLLISRIFDLERLSRESGLNLAMEGSTLLEGLQVFSELEALEFTYQNRQSVIIAECYRWAAFILLYSTMYRSSLTADKIQEALSSGLDWLTQLSATDNAQTFALFPIFVFGVAAIEPLHRMIIETEIDTCHEFSGLGNITVTKNFLESWWSKIDDGSHVINWWECKDFAREQGTAITLF